MRISHVTARGAVRRARGRLTDEAGSFLIEAMVSALLVLITGAGILQMMDRGTQLSGQQKSLATAGNLAQAEQETLRAHQRSKEGMAILSNLRRTLDPKTVGNATYTIKSRTDWINDVSGESECATAAAPADYMKLTTTVTSPALGNRPPVVLESLITPPTRSFDENQGSLAAQVNDRNGEPFSGLTLNLTGPATLSEATNENGCVLWGYIPAGSGYTVSASRSGYVEPDGTATIAEPASVTGDQTANVDLEYDRAGGIRAAFVTKKPRTTTDINSAPQHAMVEHPNAKFIGRALPVAASSLDSGVVLFPFTSPYTIYAGNCPAARPPTVNLGSAAAPPGATSAIATVALPAVDRVIKYGGTNVTSGIMKATSPCGSVVFTRTITSGVINDPGFPYGDLTNVCVSGTIGGSTRKLLLGTVSNRTFTYSGGSPPVADVNGSGSSTGACP